MEQAIQMLAMNAASVLGQYLAKGAEAFAATAGEGAAKTAADLVRRIKARLSGDPDATITLKRFEENPDLYRQTLQEILQQKLSHDKNFAEELRLLIEEMGPRLRIVQRMGKARAVVGYRGDRAPVGRTDIIQVADFAEGMTGVSVGDDEQTQVKIEELTTHSRRKAKRVDQK